MSGITSTDTLSKNMIKVQNKINNEKGACRRFTYENSKNFNSTLQSAFIN